MTDERQPQPKRESEALRMLRSRRSVPNTAAPAADGDDPPAHSLRYDIGDEIGRGGVGIVYRGKDVELGREVAMKVLSEHHVANPDVIEAYLGVEDSSVRDEAERIAAAAGQEEA